MTFPRHRPLQPSTEVTLSCPFCEGPLKGGTLSLNYTFWGFLAAGFSHLVLKFTAPGIQRTLLKPPDSKDAYLCETCGTVISPGPAIRVPRKPLKTSSSSGI